MSTTGDLTPENTIEGATTGTPIGNISDKLKVSGDATILAGLTFNKVTGTYPNNFTEVFKYYLGATLISTVTNVYSDSSKKLLSTQERVDA